MIKIQPLDKNSKFSELKKLGTGELKHINGSLEKHLKGTANLLHEWGANEWLVSAGLFHAIYGTAGYAPSLASLELREHIANLIGGQAESMVYLYCACDRNIVWPRIGTELQNKFADRFMQKEYTITNEQLNAFCELTLANEIEIILNDKQFKVQNAVGLSDLFKRMKGLVSESGFTTFKQIFQ